LSADAPADDLHKPLGQTRKKKKGFVLPIPWVTRALAGMLGVCCAVLAGWILFVDDPYGGEPAVVVSAATAATQARASDEGLLTGKPAAPSVETEKKTVTIIDGSTGKRQEVSVGQQGAAAPNEPAQKKSELKSGVGSEPTIDQRVTDTSRHGPIPKIGTDGARPADVYARPVKPQANRADAPRIAIVVEGLGISANGTAEALAKLPAPVTFAFVPYGIDIERWAARARGENHEVLLQVGMEPFDYPDNDPGPQTLLASLSAEQNIDRLHWFLARFAGYVGVTSLMGARFTATGEALSPVIRDIGKRGLIWFDDGTSPRSTAAQISGAANVAFAKADAVIDAVPTASAIDDALARLEAIAKSRGIAIGAAGALPVTINRIAEWAKQADARGILLVPISMVANRAKTGS
jgi:polysaccharide deacetylase 2 family uncharacterized protein YibQ